MEFVTMISMLLDRTELGGILPSDLYSSELGKELSLAAVGQEILVAS